MKGRRLLLGLAVGPNGTITITYTGEPRIEGKTVMMSLSLDGRG